MSPAARRPIAAIWFAAVAALATFLVFGRLAMAPHAVILYIVLPSLAAGIAGYIWGGAILDSSRVRTLWCGRAEGFWCQRRNVSAVRRALCVCVSLVGRPMVAGADKRSFRVDTHVRNSHGRSTGSGSRHAGRFHAFRVRPPRLRQE